MTGITPAQIRKIHVLGGERALDNDTLHAYVHRLTGKESLKQLTIVEAINVIDNLQGGEDNTTDGMISPSQRKYIFGLLRENGWVDDEGRIDNARFGRWIKDKFNITHERWVTVREAQMIIEALKAMKGRRDKAGAV